MDKSLSSVAGFENCNEEPDVGTVTIEEVDELSLLVRGDQIAVKGIISCFCCNEIDYYHHGIFLGHDKVADFCQEPGKSKDTARIRQVDILKFTGKDLSKLVIINHSKDVFAGEVVAGRAENQVRLQSWDSFNLVNNNCEHFANWCKTGCKNSKQVDERLAQFEFKPVRKLMSSSGGTIASTSGCCV